MTRRHVALVALVIVLAGCGRGEDDAAAPPEPRPPTFDGIETTPPQSEWAAKADALCVSYNEQIRAVQAALGPEQVERELRDVITLSHDELRGLEAIEPVTTAERPEIENLLSAMRVRIVATEQLLEATEERNESRAFRAMAREREATARAQQYREPLGLTACADARLE